MSNKTYCEVCLINKDDDQFDYLYDYPLCLDCSEDLGLEPDNEEGKEIWNTTMR